MSFDHVFAQLAEQARAVQQRPMRTPEVEAEGRSRDDLVTITLRGQEFTDATVDPRAMRESNADLAELFTQAANDALRKHQEAMVEALQSDETDFGALNKQLESVRNEANQSAQRYLESMQSPKRPDNERGTTCDRSIAAVRRQQLSQGRRWHGPGRR